MFKLAVMKQMCGMKKCESHNYQILLFDTMRKIQGNILHRMSKIRIVFEVSEVNNVKWNSLQMSRYI